MSGTRNFMECPVLENPAGCPVKCNVMLDVPGTVHRFPLVDGKPDIDIHISKEANIAESGILFAPNGNRLVPIEPRRSLMESVDAKGQEKITLSKSTLWFIGAGFVLLQVIFNYGGSLLSWTRDDQTQKEQIQSIKLQQQETRNDMKELKTQFDAIQQALQSQAVKDAESRGYQLKAAEGNHGKK